jgi:hypothetical protein
MATLTITGDTLQVRFSTFEKVLGLVRDHSYPLSAVASTRVEADGLAAARGLRAPGLGVPGRRKIGTWRGRSRTLVSVRRDQPAVVVDLAGQRFARLVIGTDDAAAVAARLGVRA